MPVPPGAVGLSAPPAPPAIRFRLPSIAPPPRPPSASAGPASTMATRTSAVLPSRRAASRTQHGFSASAKRANLTKSPNQTAIYRAAPRRAMNHGSHPLSAALCCGLAAAHGSIAFGRNRRMSRTPSRSDPLLVLLTPSKNTAYCLNVKLQPLRTARRKAFRHGAHPGERQPRRSKSFAPAVDLARRRAGITPQSIPGPETCRILFPSRPTKGGCREASCGRAGERCPS
jgi:hypothetical protein